MVSNQMSLLKHAFALLSYLVHSCTKIIFLHLFTQSVGGSVLWTFPRIITWITIPKFECILTDLRTLC